MPVCYLVLSQYHTMIFILEASVKNVSSIALLCPSNCLSDLLGVRSGLLECCYPVQACFYWAAFGWKLWYHSTGLCWCPLGHTQDHSSSCSLASLQTLPDSKPKAVCKTEARRCSCLNTFNCFRKTGTLYSLGPQKSQGGGGLRPVCTRTQHLPDLTWFGPRLLSHQHQTWSHFAFRPEIHPLLLLCCCITVLMWSCAILGVLELFLPVLSAV